jgi:hypothetical protein
MIGRSQCFRQRHVVIQTVLTNINTGFIHTSHIGLLMKGYGADVIEAGFGPR